MKAFLLSTSLLLALVSKGQTNAMDFERTNCNGSTNHLFQDLDEGKAVVLFFYMPNCGSCPPPAKKVEAMLKNIDSQYPGKVKAYAMPFNNSTKCPNVSSWVTTNNLSLYTPMDSGAAQVAYYGGFGMPTVVLLGGTDHRVMFSTQNFATGDTTAMRDSILNLFGAPTGINTRSSVEVDSFEVFPNPVKTDLTIDFKLFKTGTVKVELVDITGKVAAILLDEKMNAGTLKLTYSVADVAPGEYLLAITANEQRVSRKINITH